MLMIPMQTACERRLESMSRGWGKGEGASEASDETVWRVMKWRSRSVTGETTVRHKGVEKESGVAVLFTRDES